ncbi:hypothetical protein JOC94_002311 [Bacillus thermophilus]|uniref:Uncharacterized protein n=1 Tax=Siminovitchia thermophila TaxID=1245522 RepID=A0ABS2R829_9BACI|nr:hypothetical protein [Siminovitchia thermophila]MBM7715324.1 hypothetical protein [Siminovitchia thermophila]
MVIEVKSLQLNENLFLIDGEMINVFYKELRLIENINRENNHGKIEGYIDIVYPFAGLNLQMTFEIYTEENEEGDLDGVFKIPFVENKISLSDIYLLQHMEETYRFTDQLESEYEKCLCGGYMMPMYEEFPDWITFCNRCDSRSENTFASPIKEPC